MSVPQPISVLFVCLGNICRSTMAEAVFRFISASHHPISPLIGEIDSAGTRAYYQLHSPPDSRTMSTLRQHGIINYQHAARVVTKDDLRSFDYILVMDRFNLESLLSLRESVLLETEARGVGARENGTGGASVAAAEAEASPENNNSDKEKEVELGANIKLAEVRLFGDFGPHGEVHAQVGGGEEVQDPFYGRIDGFEEVYQQVVRFSKDFLAYLDRKHGSNE